MKVLVCAFACVKDPDRRFGSGNGGEAILGKNIILQLNKFCEVFVLTHISNKEAIEKEELFSGTKFYYSDLPKVFDFTKKWIQIYAYLWQVKAYFLAKKLHQKINFDIFHHVTYANDWMASFIGALLPIPYIRGPGGGAHRIPKGFLKDFSFSEIIKEKIRSIGQWIFRHDLFFIIGQNRAKAILVCNKEAFNALPEKWQKKAHLFPVNGVSVFDLKLMEPQDRKSNGEFSVLTAGKLIKLKGLNLVIKSFKIFHENNPQAKLIIAGDGPELQNLENLSKELKVEGAIVFLGWVERLKLLRAMTDCDIFLFLSLRDGGGNVVVEAMAAGKPIICFDLAGPGFHVDEKSGIKIKSKNSERAIGETAQALEKLYLDKELRDKLGSGAREKAEKEYSWDKLGDKLSEIYRKIL